MTRIVTVFFASVLLAGLTSAVADEPKSPVADDAKEAKADKSKDTKAIDLFNGKDLDGWQAHLVDPNVKMEDVWSVEDGILICKGEPFGFLHTKEKYTNFRLVVEWRWVPGQEPGNSGVLLRITGDPPTFLAKCAEAQLKHGDVGDIWGFYGFEVAGAKDRFVEVDHEVIGKFKGVRKIKDAEKSAGEWNKYIVTLKGDKLYLTMNGQRVNQARNLTVEPGFIGFQSEGGVIHFRTIRLVPLED